MFKPAFRTLLLATALSLSVSAFAADTDTISNMTKKDLEAHIKEFLFNNPEVITEAIQNMRQQEMKNMKLRAEKALERNKNKLINDTSSPSLGDPKKTDVTVVEFFDYHCGYCKHMLPAIKKIMKEDPKVRFVFKDLPILSEDSIYAAKIALAVWNVAPEKYFDYHTALMEHKGQYNENMLLDTAAKLGIPKAKVREVADSEVVKEALKNNRAIALDMEIRGTPAFIIGDNFLPGAIDEDLMKQAISAARKGEKLKLPENEIGNLPD